MWWNSPIVYILLHRTAWARSHHPREWSLITGKGGATKREGGQVKFNPYEMGTEKVLAMLRGGGGQNKFWGSFSTEV